MSKTSAPTDSAFALPRAESPRSMSFDPGYVSFGRSESFPLRFGWIAKGLDEVRLDPSVFVREDATVVLGVGKNMVSSIRHWLLAAGLIQPLPSIGYVDTALARIAFGEDGDPYLEDDATIWLVHWLLAVNPAGATAIYWFFNHFHKPAFANDEMSAGLATFVEREAAVRTSQTTLDRDAAMLLRMYTRTTAGSRVTLEDALDSPLSLLDLVDRVDVHHRRCAPAARAELPLSAFAFAVADVFRHLDVSQIAVSDLMYSDRARCAPGAIFRMTEEGLVSKLEELCVAAPNDYRLDRSVGAHHLYALRTVDPLAVLADHYGPSSRAAA